MNRGLGNFPDMLRSITAGMIGLALVLSASQSAVADDGDSLPERIRKSGRLMIGTYPNYPPITYKDPHSMRLKGLDIDLGEAIAKQLGLKCEWQEIAFAQMLPSLKTGRVDMIMAFMADTKGRRKTFDFVDYLTSSAVVSVRMSDTRIERLDQLCGMRIGAARSTSWPADLERFSADNCARNGKPDIIVVGTEGSFDARMQLKMERIDGAIHGSEIIGYFEALQPGAYRTIGSPLPPRLVGIPFIRTPEGEALRDAVMGALDKLKETGVYMEILKRHGAQTGALELISMNGG